MYVLFCFNLTRNPKTLFYTASIALENMLKALEEEKTNSYKVLQLLALC